MNKVKQWTVLSVVLAVAIMAGGWFLLVSPQRSEASDLKEQAATQEQANQSLQAQLASLKAQHKDIPEVQAQLAKLGVQIPDDPGLASLVRELTTAASDSGVELISLAPSNPQFVKTMFDPATGTVTDAAVAAPVAPTATDTASSETSDAPAPVAPAPAPPVGEQLAYVPVVVTVNSGYFQVEQFLSNIEALKRSFLVVGLNATPGDAPGPSSGTGGSAATTSSSSSSSGYQGTLTVTLTGRVFMRTNPPAPVAPAAPAAPVTDTASK